MGLPYNGWSDIVRHGRDRYYYPARDRGVLGADAVCVGCRESLPATCIPYHAEEYGPTLEDYWASCTPVCNRCHAMIHARFQVPNRWKRYLSQAAASDIDATEYPRSRSPSPYTLTKKYSSKPDIAFVPMPASAPSYMKALPLEEYKGRPKVALLRVLALDGRVIEVCDWTVYGRDLEKLESEGAGIDIEAARSRLKSVQGFPKYKPLYFANHAHQIAK